MSSSSSGHKTKQNTDLQTQKRNHNKIEVGINRTIASRNMDVILIDPDVHKI
jgi:hypothetical protein